MPEVISQELKLVPPLGHTDEINDIVLTKDNKFIFSCGDDHTIIQWDLGTGKEIKRFSGHSKSVTSIELSKKEDLLISKSLYQLDDSPFSSNVLEAKLWDVKTGLEINKLFSDDKEFNSVCISNDQKFTLTGYRDGTISKWDNRSGKKVFSHQLDTGYVFDIIISPDNNYALVNVSNEQSYWIVESNLVLLNLNSQKIEKVFETSYIELRSRFSIDGKSLIVNNNYLYHLPEKKGFDLVHSLSHYKLTSKHLIFSHLDSLIVMDIRTGRMVHSITGFSPGNFDLSTTYIPYKPEVLISKNNFIIERWDYEKANLIGSISIPKDFNGEKEFSLDGTLIVTGSSDNRIRVWDLSENNIKLRSRKLQPVVHKINIMAVSENGRKLMLGNNDFSQIWEIYEYNKVTKYNTGYTTQASFFPNNNLVITGDTYDGLIVWDPATSKKVHSFNSKKLENYSSHMDAFDISDNGHYITVGINYRGRDDSKYVISVFDLTEKQIVRKFSGENTSVTSLCSDPGMNTLVSGCGDFYGQGFIATWDLRNSSKVQDFEGVPAGHIPVLRLLPGQMKLLSGSNRSIEMWDYTTGKKLYSIDRKLRSSIFYTTHDQQKTIDVSSDNKWLLYANNYQNSICIADIQSGKLIKEFGQHNHDIVSVNFINENNLVFSASRDGTIKLWDVNLGLELATLMTLGGNDWVVVSPDGLFDASSNAMNEMHFVYGDEIIDLEQLKDRFYEPGLLQKLLGMNQEPVRKSRGFSGFELSPSITLDHPQNNNGNLGIHLKNRGGGIGSIKIWINGKEVTSDARESNADKNRAELDLIYRIDGHPYLKPGEPNLIEVKAYNGDQYLLSKGKKIQYMVSGNKMQSSLHAVVIGTSNYNGINIDLKYAAKDARAFADALSIIGEKLFGKTGINILELTTESDPGKWPTKDNIKNAFREIGKKANPYDVLVVYFAGHGVNYGGSEGDFYYLTSEASSGNLLDPVLREQVAISSEEITEFIKQVPALKQVMIIDACHTGQLAEDLMASREGRSASESRALEKLMDRTGTFILAGSAADAVSYETSMYGQGLLTYSLLFGMKGAALRENQFVDVMSLFQFSTDKVPDLAKNIGGIQKPEIRVPYGGESFDIGIVTEDIQGKIELPSPKPIFIRSSFQNDVTFDDDLRMTDIINNRLREIQLGNVNQPLIFIDITRFVDGYSIKGRYAQNNGTIEAVVRLFKGSEVISSFDISNSDMDKLAIQITNKALQSINTISNNQNF